MVSPPCDIPKTLHSARDHSQTLSVLLTQPRSEDETCSITLDNISENPTIHGFKIENPPLENHPNHFCMQILLCNHRFNAMSLILHFSTNSMTCPMCRAGLHDDTLNFSASFPHEPWLDVIQNLSYKSNNDEENYRNTTVHLVIPSMLFQSGIRPWIRNNNQHILEDGPVIPNNNLNLRAHFQMFQQEQDNNNEHPIITFQSALEYMPHGNGYTISNNFRRIITNGIQDIGITSMSAIIFALNIESGNEVQIATMRRIPIHSNMSEITAEVSPPIYSIRINLNVRSPLYSLNDSVLNLLEFDFIQNPRYSSSNRQQSLLPAAFDG